MFKRRKTQTQQPALTYFAQVFTIVSGRDNSDTAKGFSDVTIRPSNKKRANQRYLENFRKNVLKISLTYTKNNIR